MGRINAIISVICVFSSSLRLGALESCFLMTCSTSLSITSLVCNVASKLNLAVHENSTCCQLTTKTVTAKYLIKPNDFRIKEAATGGIL